MSDHGIRSALSDFMPAVRELRAKVEAQEKRADVLNKLDIDRINAALDQHEPANQRLTLAQAGARNAAELQERLDQLELKAQRMALFGGGDKAAAKGRAREAFTDWCRYDVARMAPEYRNVLTTSDDTGGGYLAPSEYVAEIIKAAIEYSPMRALVRTRTTSQRSVQLPRRTGTFAAHWVGELETRTETPGLSYGMDDVPVHEMTAEVYISMANLEDSEFNLEGELNAEFAEQFGVAEGAAVVNGDGFKKPEGFMNAPGTISVNSGDAAALTATGLISLKYGVKSAYARNGTWLMNRRSLRDVRTLKDTTGQFIWQPGLAQGRPNTIDGDPYVEIPDLPDVAAGSRPVAYGDWRRAYTLIDRLQISVIRDALTRATEGQVKFVARRRVGGQVVLAEAIAIQTVHV